jgi:hypothetical protein
MPSRRLASDRMVIDKEKAECSDAGPIWRLIVPLVAGWVTEIATAMKSGLIRRMLEGLGPH